MGSIPAVYQQLIAALLAAVLPRLPPRRSSSGGWAPVAAGLMFAGLHQLTPAQAALKGLVLRGRALRYRWLPGSRVDSRLRLYRRAARAVSPPHCLSAFWRCSLPARYGSTGALPARGLALVTFAGAWVLGEVLRTYLFTGFFPGYCSARAMWTRPLAGWAPLGGVYLLSLLVALSGGAGRDATAAPPMVDAGPAGRHLAGAHWRYPRSGPRRSKTPTAGGIARRATFPTAEMDPRRPAQRRQTTYSDLTRDGRRRGRPDRLAGDRPANDGNPGRARCLSGYKRQLTHRHGAGDGLWSSGGYRQSLLQQRGGSWAMSRAAIKKEHLVPFGEYLAAGEYAARRHRLLLTCPCRVLPKASRNQAPMQAAG